MIEKLKQLLLPETQEAPENTEESIQLACLIMMIETGKADHDFDEKELNTVRKVALDVYGLDENTIDKMIMDAKQAADDATSLYEFTSLINENLDEEQKYRVIQSMWRVAYADGQVDRYEEHIIRRAADLLYVEHARFIEAKLSVKEASS